MYARSTSGIFLPAHLCPSGRCRAAASLLGCCAAPALRAAPGLRAPDVRWAPVAPPAPALPIQRSCGCRPAHSEQLAWRQPAGRAIPNFSRGSGGLTWIFFSFGRDFLSFFFENRNIPGSRRRPLSAAALTRQLLAHDTRLGFIRRIRGLVCCMFDYAACLTMLYV